jgi:hypothetical protein
VLSVTSASKSSTLRDESNSSNNRFIRSCHSEVVIFDQNSGIEREWPPSPPVLDLLSHYPEIGSSNMNRKLLWLIVAAVLVIGFVLYRSRSGRNLNVDPHAREEIEKAKRR